MIPLDMRKACLCALLCLLWMPPLLVAVMCLGEK
jgi:hypothetical protein